MSASLQYPAKDRIADSFGAAAQSYDAVAALQRSVGMALLRQAPEPRGDECILDVGAGTGCFAALLEQRYSGAMVIGLDLAEGMLRVAQERFSGHCVGGDAEALPLASGSVDLVYSNLAIQWCGSVSAAFGEFYRVLKPGGRLLFSTLGPETLGELRLAWQAADSHTHVNPFVGESYVLEALHSEGFGEVTVAAEPRKLCYPGVMDLMRELKGLGARNLTPDRPRYLMGKAALARMVAAYPVHGTGGDQSVRATFDVILGCASRIPFSG